MGFIEDIDSEEENPGYDFSLEDLDQLLDSLTSVESKKGKPFVISFVCKSMGFVSVEINEFIPCNDEECEQCKTFDKLTNEILNQYKDGK